MRSSTCPGLFSFTLPSRRFRCPPLRFSAVYPRSDRNRTGQDSDIRRASIKPLHNFRSTSASSINKYFSFYLPPATQQSCLPLFPSHFLFFVSFSACTLERRYTWDDEESKGRGWRATCSLFHAHSAGNACAGRAHLFSAALPVPSGQTEKKCPIKINPKAVPARTIPPRSLLPRNSYCYLYSVPLARSSSPILCFVSFHHSLAVGMHCFPAQCISERCGSVSG